MPTLPDTSHEPDLRPDTPRPSTRYLPGHPYVRDSPKQRLIWPRNNCQHHSHRPLDLQGSSTSRESISTTVLVARDVSNFEIEKTDIREPAGHHGIWQIVGDLVEQPYKSLGIRMKLEMASINSKSKLLQCLHQAPAFQFDGIVFPFSIAPNTTIKTGRFGFTIRLNLREDCTPSNSRRSIDRNNNRESIQ